MSKKEVEKFFVGDKEVLGVELADRKTPAENDVVIVTLEDGSKITISKRRFDAIKSPIKEIGGAQHERLLGEVARKIYALMLEYDLRFIEIDSLITRLVKQINDTLTEATNTLWNISHEDERSLIKMNDILLAKHARKEGDNGATS